MPACIHHSYRAPPGWPTELSTIRLLPRAPLVQHTAHIVPVRLRDKRYQGAGGQQAREKTNKDPGAHRISKISETLVVW